MTELQQGIIDAARALLAVPFHHQGRSIKGVDCAGVVYLAAWANHIALEDVQGYGRQPSGKVQLELERQMIRVPLAEVEVGDVLLIRFDEPQHVALVTNVAPLCIIHAYGQVGRVVEHQVDEHYMKRILRAYRFRELAHG